jgi:hypothetical protein
MTQKITYTLNDMSFTKCETTSANRQSRITVKQISNFITYLLTELSPS